MSIINIFSPSSSKDVSQNTVEGVKDMTYDPTNEQYLSHNIANVSGFDYLELTLKQPASIYARAECQLFIDNRLSIESLSKDVKLKGLHDSFNNGHFYLNKISIADVSVAPAVESMLTSPTPTSTPVETPTTTTTTTTPSGEIVSVKGGVEKPKGFFSFFKGGNDVSDSEDGSEYEDDDEIAPQEDSGNLSIYSILPGNIMSIVLNIGDEWCIHHNAFLACTENITVETALSFKLSVTKNGTFYTKVRNESNQPGMVWLVSYGGINLQSLGVKNNFKIHSGLFLAVKSHIYEQMRIKYASNLYQNMVGGELIMLDFSETRSTMNDELFMQSGNIDEFMFMLTNSVPKSESERIGTNMSFEKTPEPVESSEPAVAPTVSTPQPLEESTKAVPEQHTMVTGPKGGKTRRRRSTRRK